MAQRIGLVGCVRQKLPVPAKAKDLYVSPLFLGRRSFVEGSCGSWWIISAKYGLVHPEELLERYDVTLKGMGRAARREWAKRVLGDFIDTARPHPGDVVEIHAGSDYREFGLAQGLEEYGCLVVVPTAGLRMGRQLAFYADHASGEVP